MRKMQVKATLLALVMLFSLLTQMVYAAPGTPGATPPGTSAVKTVIELDLTDAGFTGKVKVDSAVLIPELQEDFRLDMETGLQALKDTVPTRDYIELKTWGVFMFTYLNKEVTEYPNEAITIETATKKYVLKPSKLAKEWVKTKLIPELLTIIETNSKAYPVEMYRMNVAAGVKLQELKLEVNAQNAVKVYTLYPLKGRYAEESIPELIVCNTGISYGLVLNKEYVQALKGYHNEADYLKSLDAAVPSCVNVLAYITLPKNVEGLKDGSSSFQDKYLKDMSIYKDLAINLITKELIDTANTTTAPQDLKFKDYRLVEEDLILIPLKDTVVVVQPIYLECFRWGKWDLNTGHKVNLTDFLTGAGTKVAVGEDTTDVSTYITADNFMDTQLGKNNPFLVYATSEKFPYGRVIKWLYSDAYSARMKVEERDNMVKEIKAELKKQGRSADFNKYLKEAGQMTPLTKILLPIILVVVLVVVAFVVVILSKKKKQKQEAQTGGLLFDTEDYDSGDTDDYEDNDD